MANSPVNGSVIEAVPGNAPGSSNGCVPKNLNRVKQEPEHLGEENGIHVEDVFVNVKQEVETDMTNVCDNIAIEQNEQLERETNREDGPPLKRRTVVKGESLTLYTIRRRKRTENGDEAPELGRKLKQGSRSAVASSEMAAPPKCPSRSSPVSQFEKECLLGIVRDFMPIIADKSTSFVATSRKATMWQDVAARFNAATGYSKSSQQVRKIWENIRNRAKKEYIRVMQEQGKTGGPPSTPVDTLSSQVLPLIENELEPVDNPWDCDSDLHSQSVLEESDPSIEPECIAAPSAESEYHSVATPEPDHLSGTIAMPQPSDVPSLEPESLEGPSGEPEPIAASSIEPGRAHESCATVTDDSPAQVVPVQRVRSTRKRKVWSSSRSKEDTYDVALRLADERNKKRMEMDQALHKQKMHLVEMQMAYLEEYHQRQLGVLEMQRQYWEKKSEKD
nr:myb/SANT-like DNA-binding domain-containing protein 3 isoform X2 [Procambarus clarkii]